MKIAVAGTGYVGLSIAILLSQNHEVIAVDVVPEKVEMINSRQSPIQDEYIEKYLKEKELYLTATLDAKKAYGVADFVLMDFSLLSPLEFFADPKNGDGRNNKPPAMRVRVDCYTKKLPFRLQ